MTSEGKYFTFVWKLENASYCIQKTGECIESPAFVVDALEGTKWKLHLYPKGKSEENDIEYFLHREEDSSGRDNLEIKYELAFIGIDGSDLTNSSVDKRIFPKGAAFGHRYTPIEDLFVTWRSIYLPNDTLSLRCRIWKIEGEMENNVKITALTRIGVEKRTYKWVGENFSILGFEKKLNYQIKSVQNDLPLMSVLQLSPRIDTEENIQFTLYLQDLTIKFATLKLFIVNAPGKIDFPNIQIWFDSPTKCIIFNFTTKYLLERKDIFLTNDTLSMIWVWGFSRGIVLEEYVNISSGVEISDKDISCENQKSIINNFLASVKCLYDERFLSDVKLKTETSEFPAHKFKLSASSSVFKAMFSSDMKEKINDCVHIEDLEDDTVSRMLHFIYTTRLEGLTRKRAINLYAAADKYDISSLKTKCSSFLKKYLSPSNACDVLLLADRHTDDDLKYVVVEYIIKNGKQITKSEEWKALMKANSMLAAETLCQLFR